MLRKRITRFILLAMAIVASGYALAQAPLPPNLTGRNTENGRMIFDAGMFAASRNTGLTAFAGGGQANGTPLNRGMNQFTTVATIGDSATLPIYSNGLIIYVVNATSNSMNIFPGVGGQINALSTNGAYALAAGKAVIFFQAADGFWYANLSA